MVISASSCGADVLIFRRTDDDKRFDENWQDFKQGFGSSTQNKFWIGNDRIHELTTSEGYTKLRIEMRKRNGWPVSTSCLFIIKFCLEFWHGLWRRLLCSLFKYCRSSQIAAD